MNQQGQQLQKEKGGAFIPMKLKREESKGRRVSIRFKGSDYKDIVKMADAQNMSVSEFLRQLALTYRDQTFEQQLQAAEFEI